MLQEVLARLGLRVRPVRPVQPDPLVIQAQRVLREMRVRQDLQVLQETRERLDRLVHKAK